MSAANSPTPSLELAEEEQEKLKQDAEEEQEDIESFRQWMGFVNRCLNGRLTEEDTGKNEEKEEFLDEYESDAERNMRIARSVLDEETALDMARTFIKLTKVPTRRRLSSKYRGFNYRFLMEQKYITELKKLHVSRNN